MTVTTGARGDEVGLVLVRIELDVEAGQDLRVLLLGSDDADAPSRARCRAAASVSSGADWVAVTISPSWVKTTWTSEPGFAPIRSAKSARLAPRGSRICLAVAARDLHATDRRRLHVVELLAPLLLRLPAAHRATTRATTERTLGRGAATAATGTTGTPTEATRSPGRAAGTTRPAGEAAATDAGRSHRRGAAGTTAGRCRTTGSPPGAGPAGARAARSSGTGPPGRAAGRGGIEPGRSRRPAAAASHQGQAEWCRRPGGRGS